MRESFNYSVPGGDRREGSRPSRHAFTLIELVIVIVISGILGGMSFGFLGNSAGVYAAMLSQKRTEAELLDAVERMRREIRTLRTVTSGSDAAFSFVNAQTEDVQFACGGGSLALNGHTLARGVESCAFMYFASGGNELSAPLSAENCALVGRIQLALRITNSMAASETIVNFHLIEGFVK